MMKRTKRACQVCSKPFYGSTDCHYCPDCAKAKKLDTVVKIRVCKDFRAEFYGGPRARRCPDCAYKVAQETSRHHKRTGAKRPLGSVDNCAVCGKEYIVKSSRQKYCSDACMRKGVLEWQREHKKGTTKHLGRTLKRWSGAKRHKRSVLTARGLLPQISQLLTALTIAGRNRQSFISASRI